MKFIVPAVLAAVFCISQAAAATVDQFVNESAAGSGGFPSGGDYARDPGLFGDNDLGNIRIGLTQIDGNLRIDSGDLADWFFFDVAPERAVISAFVSAPPPSNERTEIQVQIIDENQNYILVENVSSDNAVDILAGFSGGLGPGKYNVGILVQGTNPPNQDWSIQARLVETPAVPLPAGLPLLLAGLGGLAVLRRRT